MSYAVMRPYGGFSSGRSRTFGTGPPRPAVYAALFGSGGSVFTTPATNGRVTEPTYTNPVSESDAPDCQLPPPPNPGATMGPRFTPRTTIDGGAYGPPRRYGPALIACNASSRSAGVKSIRSSVLMPTTSKGGGLVGIGCVFAVYSVGTSVCSTGTSGIGHTGWPFVRSNTHASAILPICTTALIGRPFTLMSTRIGWTGMS